MQLQLGSYLPTEEPYSSIHVDGVESRYRPRLVVDWVDLRGLEQQDWVVHDGGFDRVLSRVVDTIFEGGICKSRGVLSQGRMPDQVGSRGQSI